MKCGILRMTTMMCGCRLSPLPHSGDVLGIVSTCLTCQLLHCLRALGLLCSPWNRLRSSGKNQNIKPSCRPPCPHAENCVGSGGKIIPHTKTHRGFFCCCPSCGQKSEKQAGMREGLVMAELKTDLNAQTGLFSLSSFLCNCFHYFQEQLFSQSRV